MQETWVDAIGVAAATILMATLIGQTVKQWHERTTRGVARWFFLGQVSASAGFVVYSVLTGSLLFAVTNGLILLSALAGYIVLRMNRRRAARRLPAPSESALRGAAGHRGQLALR
jgi:MtN3 and saliva related transmembrane protein